MTMPHLVNCPHSEDGWCLNCVKELWEQGATVALNRQLNIMFNGHSWPIGEVVSIEPISMVRPVHEEVGKCSDTTLQFAPGDHVTVEYKITCVSRRASDG